MTIGPCQPFRHLLSAYVDGQLEPATVLAIEEHLEDCEACRERIHFQRAVATSTRRAVLGEKPSPSARARFAAALESTRADIEEVASAAIVPTTPVTSIVTAEPVHKRNRLQQFAITAVPLTAAAALALLWGTSAQSPFNHASLTNSIEANSKDMLDEFVHEHAVPLRPEATDVKDVRELGVYAGIPVRPHAFEKTSGAKLRGGRVMPMHQERAVMLQYEMGSGADTKRVSVLLYDPRRIQVGGAELVPQTVGTAEVRVGREKGYQIAVTQRDGVGYALAGDFDPERTAQLVNFVSEE